jgi:hypothetical protein
MIAKIAFTFDGFFIMVSSGGYGIEHQIDSIGYRTMIGTAASGLPIKVRISDARQSNRLAYGKRRRPSS